MWPSCVMRLMLALVRLLVEVHYLASSVQIGYLTVLFQMNQRYRDVRHDLASLRPYATLSELAITPVSFRGLVPLGSGFAHPSTSGECLDRMLGVGPELAQAQDTLAGGPVVAQTHALLRRPSVSLRSQLGLSWLFRRLRGRRTTMALSFSFACRGFDILADVSLSM